jgi:hypothetical protein
MTVSRKWSDQIAGGYFLVSLALACRDLEAALLLHLIVASTPIATKTIQLCSTTRLLAPVTSETISS